MIGQLPAINTPDELMQILGIKSRDSLNKLKMPRCRLYPKGQRFVYLASDLIAYLESRREVSDPDDDIDFDLD